MAEVLVDTNIFIGIFSGNKDLKEAVEALEAAVCTVVYLELIQGSKDKREVRIVENYLSRFKMLHFTENVSKRAIELTRTYSKSHGLLLADAVIAATCLEARCALLTFNMRDFKFIKGINLATL